MTLSRANPSFHLRKAFPGILLFSAVVVTYLPALHGNFLWDDDIHVTTNPCLIGPLGFKEIWTTMRARICPLVISSFWLQHWVWGLQPLPYHLVTIGFHALNAVVLWRVLLRLRVPGAWLGAGLWAVHPVQVESVAWISELKNTQSGFFFLLSILWFLKFIPVLESSAPSRKHLSYALALVFAACALTSKSSTVVLPLVLILCLWWERKLPMLRRVPLVEPFFLLAIIAGSWSMISQGLEGANRTNVPLKDLERLAIVGKVFWFYAGKLIWPSSLMFIYPRWQPQVGRLTEWIPSLALVGFCALLWWRSRTPSSLWRGVTYAFLYFLIALAPVLCVLNHYFMRYSFVGDHFQYLASMGPLALAGAGLTMLGRQSVPALRPVWIGAGCAWALALACVSWKHEAVFRSDEVLFSDSLGKNPNCCMAEANLARTLFLDGRTAAALVHYRKTLELGAGIPEYLHILGMALLRTHGSREAVDYFQRFLASDPDNPDGAGDLGLAYLQSGRMQEAREQFQRAGQLRVAKNKTKTRSDSGGAATIEASPHDETEALTALSNGNSAPKTIASTAVQECKSALDRLAHFGEIHTMLDAPLKSGQN